MLTLPNNTNVSLQYTPWTAGFTLRCVHVCAILLSDHCVYACEWGLSQFRKFKAMTHKLMKQEEKGAACLKDFLSVCLPTTVFVIFTWLPLSQAFFCFYFIFFITKRGKSHLYIYPMRCANAATFSWQQEPVQRKGLQSHCWWGSCHLSDVCTQITHRDENIKTIGKIWAPAFFSATSKSK